MNRKTLRRIIREEVRRLTEVVQISKNDPKSADKFFKAAVNGSNVKFDGLDLKGEDVRDFVDMCSAMSFNDREVQNILSYGARGYLNAMRKFKGSGY